jgi:hypothetical protein
MDASAMEAAYNVTRPPIAKEFGNWSENSEYIPWWVVARETLWVYTNSASVLETMPEMVGFSALEVDQAILFGSSPSESKIMTGNFDADGIADAYEANLAFEQINIDGMTVWCWVEGCSEGAQSDSQNQIMENPFGGLRGQRQPMVISNDLLMASPDLDLVVAHLRALAGSQPSLDDDPDYRVAVNAISQDAYIPQAMIVTEARLHRIVKRMPIDVGYKSRIQLVSLNPHEEASQELPQYDLLILADAVTEDEHIARLGLIYMDANSAEKAATIILDRLESEQSKYEPKTFSELLADRNVTNPRYYVYEGDDRVTLVLEFPTHKATADELIQMLDIYSYKGDTTRPGFIYRLILEMILQGDTHWLSTGTRAE